MALVLTEPFNNFTTNGWTSLTNATIVAGRTGTAAQLTASTGTAQYPIASGAESSIITLGFAWRYTDANTGVREFLQIRSDASVTLHNRFQVNASGGIDATRGSTVIASSAGGVITAANTWYYIELQITLSDTTGSVVVRVNGTQVINATGLDTKNGGTKTTYDTIAPRTTVSGHVHHYDDLYLRNDSTFQGDPTLNPLSGSGAIFFGGTGVAKATVPATGSGAIAFAGSGTAIVTFLGGSGAIVFDGRGTAKISPVIVTGVGHIDFGGRGDIDVAPHLDVYAPPEWSWMVLDPDGSPIGPLTAATARKLTFQIDGAATVSFTMPGEHPETATIAELGTDLYVARNGRPLFRGRIGGSSETHEATADTVNLTVTDYRGLLDHRLLWPDSQLEFKGVDQADIVWQLIADSQALDDLGITRGRGSVTGVVRDRTFTAGATVGQSIKDVAGVVEGFDWEIGPDLAFNLYCPERGRYPADVPTSSPILTYGRDVVSVTTSVDPSKYGNAVYFTGAQDTDPAMPVAAAPPGVGRWELQRADVNATLQTTIDEEAAGQLAASSQLISAITVTLAADVWNPYLLWLGDRVRVLVDAGRLDLDVRRRILQIDVTLDDTGVETVVLAIGSAPPKLSDRLTNIHKEISDLQRRTHSGGGGGGGGGGGDGGIKEITSIGGTILVTSPTGPTTNLEVASHVGAIAVTNPTGPVVNLEYVVPGSDTVFASYIVGVLTDLVSFHEYGFYSFAGAVVPWLQAVPGDEAGFLPESYNGEQLVKITQPGTYTLSVHVSTIMPAHGTDIDDNEVIYPIDCGFMGLDLASPYEGFNIGHDAPKTLSGPPVRITEFDLANNPLAGWHFTASLGSSTRWMEAGAEISLQLTLTRVA